MNLFSLKWPLFDNIYSFVFWLKCSRNNRNLLPPLSWCRLQMGLSSLAHVLQFQSIRPWQMTAVAPGPVAAAAAARSNMHSSVFPVYSSDSPYSDSKMGLQEYCMLLFTIPKDLTVWWFDLHSNIGTCSWMKGVSRSYNLLTLLLVLKSLSLLSYALMLLQCLLLLLQSLKFELVIS